MHLFRCVRLANYSGCQPELPSSVGVAHFYLGPKPRRRRHCGKSIFRTAVAIQDRRYWRTKLLAVRNQRFHNPENHRNLIGACALLPLLSSKTGLRTGIGTHSRFQKATSCYAQRCCVARGSSKDAHVIQCKGSMGICSPFGDTTCRINAGSRPVESGLSTMASHGLLKLSCVWARGPSEPRGHLLWMLRGWKELPTANAISMPKQRLGQTPLKSKNSAVKLAIWAGNRPRKQRTELDNSRIRKHD